MNDQDRKSLVDYVERTAKALKESAVCLSLFTDDYNKGIDAIIQFGLALMLDKPIYLIVAEGTEIPEKVKRVADGIRYFKKDDLESSKLAAAQLLLEAREKGHIPKIIIQ